MFGELIIMIVFLPILTLEGVEGKIFRPMALTMIFALVGSLVLSLTLMPVLASLFLPKRINEKEPWLVRQAHRSLMFFSSSACSSEARQQRFTPAKSCRARGDGALSCGAALVYSGNNSAL